MAQLIVRNLEDDVRDKLRARAQSHGRSMEDEVRDILRTAVVAQPSHAASKGLGTRMVEMFADDPLEEAVQFPEQYGGPPRPAIFE